MLRRIARCLFLGFSAAPLAAQFPPVIQSTFQNGVDGWTHVGASVFKQEPAGGNPKGFLFVDNSEGPVTWIVAPSKFLGDLSGYDGGRIMLDGTLLARGGSPWGPNPQDYGNVYLHGTSGSASADLAAGVPLMGVWQHYELPFTAAAFNQTPAAWSALLASVTKIEISVEAFFGAEIEGIDNVRLEPVLPPSSCTLRNGHGVNPVDFQCITNPLVGATWNTTIVTPSGTVASAVAIAAAPSPGVPSPFGAGELLLGTEPFFTHLALAMHAIPIPLQAPLIGATATAQGFRVSSVGAVQALNAQDLVLNLF